MEHKRSRGVTIFAWLILIGSIFNLAAMLPAAAQQAASPISPFLYITVGIISIVVAMNLLKLAGWARMAIIIISVIVAAETLATAPTFFKKNQEVFALSFDAGWDGVMENMKKDPEKAAALDIARMEESREKTKETALKLNRIFLTALMLLSAGFNLGVIYFFTRPKIVEQFG